MTAKPQLKEFEIRNWAGSGSCQYVYAKFEDGWIVFSGSGRGTTSISNAERVILAIAKLEHIKPLECRWFDLQTHRMYGHRRHWGEPSEFMFNELQIVEAPPAQVPAGATVITNGTGISVSHWVFVECPSEVIELFSDVIGPNPYQKKNRDDHRPGSEAHLDQLANNAPCN